MSSNSSKNDITYELFIYKSYVIYIYIYIYIYKEDLVLNNQQGLIYYKTQSNQIFYPYSVLLFNFLLNYTPIIYNNNKITTHENNLKF